MGTRTRRIPAHKLPEQLPSLEGKHVQVVLRTGQTRMGSVTIQEDVIILTDLNARWYNRKRHLHHLQLDTIREVLLDEVSDW